MSDDKRKPFKKKLCVTSQKVLATWPNSKGTSETNLYEVVAVDENGERVNQKLRSFAELELNVLIEYEIEPYTHPQHGKSWTVKKPRSNTTQRVGHLEKQMEDVLDRLSAAEARLGIGPAAASETKETF